MSADQGFDSLLLSQEEQDEAGRRQVVQDFDLIDGVVNRLNESGNNPWDQSQTDEGAVAGDEALDIREMALAQSKIELAEREQVLAAQQEAFAKKKVKFAKEWKALVAAGGRLHEREQGLKLAQEKLKKEEAEQEDAWQSICDIYSLLQRGNDNYQQRLKELQLRESRLLAAEDAFVKRVWPPAIHDRLVQSLLAQNKLAKRARRKSSVEDPNP